MKWPPVDHTVRPMRNKQNDHQWVMLSYCTCFKEILLDWYESSLILKCGSEH
jgi:hypothetical protein